MIYLCVCLNLFDRIASVFRVVLWLGEGSLLLGGLIVCICNAQYEVVDSLVVDWRMALLTGHP